METMMTELEKFHQFLLFKLLDANIPEWVKFMAVDGDGTVILYGIRPQYYSKYDEWVGGNDQSLYHILITGLLHVDIPEPLTSKECIWKL